MTGASLKLKVRFRTCRRSNEPTPVPRVFGPSTIARRLALAHHIEALIALGELRDYADAAGRLGLSRARVTQIADLALLAPNIQAAALLGYVTPRDSQLREVGRHLVWAEQLRIFTTMFPKEEQGL